MTVQQGADTDPTHIADLLDQGAIVRSWPYSEDKVALVLGGHIEKVCTRAELTEARKIGKGGR